MRSEADQLISWPQLGGLCQLCHAKTSQPPKVSKVSRVSFPWSPSQSRFRAVATLFLTPWLLLQCLSSSLSRVGKETPETPEEDLHGSAASGVVDRCCGSGAGTTKEEDCALEVRHSFGFGGVAFECGSFGSSWYIDRSWSSIARLEIEEISYVRSNVEPYTT